MDCIVYIDLFFLLNFWTNLLVFFLVRRWLHLYRTLRCVLAAVIPALASCLFLLLYFRLENRGIFLLHIPALILAVFVAFGWRKLPWHLCLVLGMGVMLGGSSMAISAVCTSESVFPIVCIVCISCFLACAGLEKQCKTEFKEEHMKAKTVLEFEDRKMFATALIDTGNKLYDPFYHKPVILVDERMMRDVVYCCKEHHPEKLQYIPYHSVGRQNGMLEGVMFDSVSIQWKEKYMKFQKVIAASTKESLYKGKEYQVIFHCGLLEEL